MNEEETEYLTCHDCPKRTEINTKSPVSTRGLTPLDINGECTLE